MPAVQAFCLYAGVAILANFALQMTAFLAVFAIDLHRSSKNGLECEPFLQFDNNCMKADWISVHNIIRFFMEHVYSRVILFFPIRVIIVSNRCSGSSRSFTIFFLAHFICWLDWVCNFPSTSFRTRFRSNYSLSWHFLPCKILLYAA